MMNTMRPIRPAIVMMCSTLLMMNVEAATIHLTGGKTLEAEVLSVDETGVRVKTARGEEVIKVDRLVRPEPNDLKKAAKAINEGNFTQARRLAEITLLWEPSNGEARQILEQAIAGKTVAADKAKAMKLEKEAIEATQALRTAASNMGKNPPADPEVFHKELTELRDATAEAVELYKATAQSGPLTALLGSMDDNLKKVAAAVERKKAAMPAAESTPPVKSTSREKILPINAPGAMVDINQFTVPGAETLVFFHFEEVVACKALGLRLEELAKGHPRVFLRAVDIGGWKSPVAGQYKIESVPSVWVFDQKGKLVAKGLNNPEAIVEALRKAAEQGKPKEMGEPKQ